MKELEAKDARIAELEAELQNPSGGWYCTDCGSADALVSITFRIAELEAERDMAYASNRELRLLLREARHQGYAGHPTDWSLRVDAVLGPDKARSHDDV